METFGKETDMLIRKSAAHKNDFVPGSYKTRLLNTLENLPEKPGTAEASEISDVEIVEKRHKIEFRAIASAAAAVVLLFGGYSFFSGIVKTGNKPEVTEPSAIIETEETTEAAVSESKISAVYDETCVTTVTEETTEETQTETDDPVKENINNVVIPAPKPDQKDKKAGHEDPEAKKNAPPVEPKDSKKGPDESKEVVKHSKPDAEGTDPENQKGKKDGDDPMKVPGAADAGAEKKPVPPKPVEQRP